MNTIRIYSPEFALLHEFEDFLMCSATMKYAEASTISISVMAESTAAPYLLDGFYVSINNDWFIIRSRSESIDTVSVIGYSPFALLKQRIAIEQRINGTVDSMVKELINANTIGARSLPLTCEPIRTIGTVHEWATSRQQLNTEIESILKLDESGIKMLFSGDGFTFDTYHGVDRTTDNADNNEPVIFAVKYDNLISYTHDSGNFNTVNVVYVEDNSGTISEYNPNEASGVNRYEATARIQTAENGSGTISDTGAANIVERKNSITATVAPYTYIYGTDYFLGDIVTIEKKAIEAIKNDEKYDLVSITRRYSMRITSIDIDYLSDTITYTPTFGTYANGLQTLLKKQRNDIKTNSTAINTANKRITALESAITNI